MTANDIQLETTSFDSRDHAARVLADTRRRQLELAIEGRPQESAVYADMASNVRSLLDELDAIDDQPGADDLNASRVMAAS